MKKKNTRTTRKKKAKTVIIRRAAFPRFRFHRVVLCATVFLLSFNTHLRAGEARKPPRHALIFGTVWGPGDHGLPGMEVKIRAANQKKARWDLVSNARGEFEALVPAGPADYVVWAVTKHYKLPDGRHLQPSPEVRVHVDDTERADTGLHL